MAGSAWKQILLLTNHGLSGSHSSSASLVRSVVTCGPVDYNVGRALATWTNQASSNFPLLHSSAETLWIQVRRIFWSEPCSFPDWCAVLSRSVVSNYMWPHELYPPGSSLHGILQEIILEWVAMPSSRDLPNPGIEPRSLALQVDSLTSESSWVTCAFHILLIFFFFPSRVNKE